MSLSFRHDRIDPNPPSAHHDVTLLTDLTGNGLKDIIIGCKQGEFNLFWYEALAGEAGAMNRAPTRPSAWKLHVMAVAPELEAGGVLHDLTGNGKLDVIVGQQWGGTELYWFEQPDDPREPWTKRVIEDRFQKYHDQAVGDINDDGKPELVVLSQLAQVLVYYDIPADPTVEPWPRECCHTIAQGLVDVEGLAICDIDGDGKTELIAGPAIYRRGATPSDPWSMTPFADGWEKTRVAVADLSGDGRLDIVIAEGESNPGRLAWCSPDGYEPKLLREDLFHPHSLEIADFDGDGRPDIFVAEMGLGKNENPRGLIYLNRGGGELEEVEIWSGTPTHEAKVADVNGNGKPDIVGKPYHPESHIDIWWNES